MLWYMLLMLMLYCMCGVTVVMMMLMLMVEFDFWFLMMFEMYTILFFFLVNSQSSSFERGGANIFIMFFGFVMSFSVVMCNSLMMMGLMLLLLGLAKLPMYGVHMWLPKVHVEASMIGSMVLAGAVLKLSILYMWNFGSMYLVSLIIVMSILVMGGVVDGKGFAAYSSVLHMSLCVMLSLMIMLLVGYMHVVLSPLMFMSVYMAYNNNGSRFYMKMSLLMMVLWMINFSLPFLSSFFSEVYVMQNVGWMMLMIVLMYMMVGYIMMKSINMDGSGLFYMPWLVLYLMIM